MHARTARWPAPMFRQFLLLAWCAGIFASRYFLPAFTVLVLIAAPCLWRLSQKRAAHSYSVIPEQASPIPSKSPQVATGYLGSLLMLLFCFSVGNANAGWRSPVKLPLPAWAEEAITPGEGSELYRNGLRVSGTVDEVSGLTDRRLRIILSAVKPLDASVVLGGEQNEQELPGRLVFTWYEPFTPEAHKVSVGTGAASHETLTNGTSAWHRPESVSSRHNSGEESARLSARPVPGQKAEITLKLREVRALLNPGVWDLESYWADRGVWQRAWGRGQQVDLRLVPTSSQHCFSATNT